MNKDVYTFCRDLAFLKRKRNIICCSGCILFQTIYSSHIFTYHDQVVNDVIEVVSKRRLIVLVGVAGSGKRSAIIEACRNTDIAYRQKLVDPSQFDADELSSEQVHACVVNNLLFNNIDDVDKYVHQIKLRLFPHENVITFLPLCK